ncbi:DNA polymerase III subunit delta' C-terminal domain-containing protein [Candidatus Fukatsuia anoeciicola]|uniref:DNA polymerase III subunit delta' C-terminal domain-containing protein n=1 Tax=Candidatus Fukatsuia anoeciicola TaxID=2994492 RepID=UPI003463CF30
MNWYPWLTVPYRQLINQYMTGHNHHALLLYDIGGNGIDALIYGLSRWLMCQQRKNEKSCNQCYSCRLMLTNNHPDYYLLDTKKDKNSLGIDSIRRVIDKLHTHAQQGENKIVVLPHIELLTDIATNALLKTLEEPPEKIYFLLQCCQSYCVSPTLRSRCLYYYLTNPNINLSLSWLTSRISAEPITILTALKLSAGAPLKAEQLLQPEQWQRRLTYCSVLVDTLSSGNILSFLPQLNHDDIDKRLYWLISLLIDALKWHQGCSRFIINQDQQSLVQLLAYWRSIQTLLKLTDQWLRCSHRLLSITGINRELLLTEQLLNWENL